MKIPDCSIYIITSDLNKFSNSIFKAKSKELKLATNKNFATVEKHAIGNKGKIEKIETLNFSYFLVKNYFSDGESQNMFVSQPKFSTIDYKQVHTG